ncbi:NUMOD4 domain-containing protein, partial [Hymenobacter crusticola]
MASAQQTAFVAGQTVQYPSHSSTSAVIAEIWDHTTAELDNGQRVPLTALGLVESDEQWRPVTGFEDLYRVSSHGKVVSLRYKRLARHRLLRVLSPLRYPSVNLCNDLTTQQIGLNRLVALHFLAPPTQARFDHVIPKDGNHFNLRVENLQWVDQAERDDVTVLKRFH